MMTTSAFSATSREDEHDVAEGQLVQRVDGEPEVFLADARAPLAEVSEATGVDLVAAVGEMAEEIDTLGGMVVTLAGRVPVRGELIEGPGELAFEVLEADPRRLKRLRVQRGPARIEAVVPLALPPPVQLAPGAAIPGLGAPQPQDPNAQ